MDEKETQTTINQFVIYDIVLSESTEKNLLVAEDGKTVVEHAQEIFGSLFEHEGKKLKHLQLWKTITKDGFEERVDYPNDILAVNKDIYLLRVNNVQVKKLTKEGDTETNGAKDYVVKEEISNPYCYVVIDNRKGVLKMAIQQSSAWGKPENVQKMLSRCLGAEMHMRGLDLGIYPKVRASKIEEFCETQCRENDDEILRFSFDMMNQSRVARANRIPSMKGSILAAHKLMQMSNAIKTHLEMEYAGASAEDISKISDQFAYVIRACGNESYKLKIKFRKYGEYACDDLVRAQFKMNEELLDSFRTDFLAIPYNGQDLGLIEWCDEIVQKSAIYGSTAKTPGKKRRRH